MKRLPRLTGLCCLVLLGATPAGAQEGGAPPVPKRKFDYGTKIEVVYEKKKDYTTVFMNWYRVTEEPKEPDVYRRTRPPEISIRAGFGYAGRVMKSTPPAVDFHINAEYEGDSYFRGKEMPELIAVVDGERISLGKPVLTRSKTTLGVVGPGQVTIEGLGASFTYQGLLRLVNAGKVSMSVGRMGFELKERHLEALRDLASRMVP
ncbi:MAG TPA: hypothetical protein VGX48_17915 [Pyrinomonadaceae bacterium]|jgi:hypothetical protein|nr:hypothetical protein [Pyrinomonadaceae bacterium]